MLLATFHLYNQEAQRELSISIKRQALPHCSEPTYIGIILDRALTFRRHLASLRKKLTTCVRLLRRLAGRPGMLTPQHSAQPIWPWCTLVPIVFLSTSLSTMICTLRLDTCALYHGLGLGLSWWVSFQLCFAANQLCCL